MTVVRVIWQSVTGFGATQLSWLLVAVVSVNAAAAVGISAVGVPLNAARPYILIGVPVALAIVFLQARLSFAVAYDEPDPWAPLMFVTLIGCVYLPMFWLGATWVTMQAYVIASAPMVLRRWPAAIVSLATVVGSNIWIVHVRASDGATTEVLVFWAIYETVLLAITAAPILGVALLVRTVRHLAAAREELAAMATQRERLRISRDLHDLLGQSLTAVSFKGDLALRLLSEDKVAARAEIESLTQVARTALQSVRRVSENEHTVSLRTELEGAAALLDTAGVRAEITSNLTDIPAPLEELLAWALREGVTNVLRHSNAHVCSIVVGRSDAQLVLEMINDGALSKVGDGSGLRGLSARAQARSGSVLAERLPGERFRLVVKVPESAA